MRDASPDKKNEKLNEAVNAIADTNIDLDGKAVLKGIINTVRWNEPAPDGKILKSDVSIAKNYLNEEHLKMLERIVTSYLDLAENRALNRQVMNMKEWGKFLVQFLELTDYPILKDKGAV